MELKMYKIVTTIILFSSLHLYGQSDSRFSYYKPADGLSNNIVYDIVQDVSGYLWIATLDGLNRFDGYDFKVFRNDQDDSTSLPFNSVYSLAVDHKGNLWAGTRDNISKYIPETQSFVSYKIDKTNVSTPSNITKLFFDSKGKLFIGTVWNDIQAYDENTNLISKIPYDSYLDESNWGWIDEIMELKNGNIIVADQLNGPLLYDKKRNIFKSFDLNNIDILKRLRTIFEDRNGNIWFGGKDRLLKFYPDSKKYEQIEYFKGKSGGRWIVKFIQDESGKLWIRTQTEGIIVMDPNSNSIIKREFNENFPATNFYRDKSGIFWSALSGGIEKFDTKKNKFKHYPISGYDENNSLIQSIIKIATDKFDKNKILFSTNLSEISEYDLFKKSSKQIITNADLSDFNRKIERFSQDRDGNIWFYPRNDTLFYKYDRRSEELSSYDIGDRKIFSGRNFINKFTAAGGKIFIAYRAGLVVFNTQTKKFSKFPTIMNKKLSDDIYNKLKSIVNASKPIANISSAGEEFKDSVSFGIDSTQKVLVLSVGEGRAIANRMFDYGWITDSKNKKLWNMNDLRNTFNAGGAYKNRIGFGILELKPGDYSISYKTDIGHSYDNWNQPPPHNPDWYGIRVIKINNNDYSYFEAALNSLLDNSKYMPVEVILDFKFSRKDQDIIYLGTSGNGVIRFNMMDSSHTIYEFTPIDWSDKTQESNPPENTSDLIYEDRSGILWISTRNGLYRLDDYNNSWEKIDHTYGLKSIIIKGITEDLHGNLWIATLNELYSFNKEHEKNKWRFLKYNTKDGLTESLISSNILTQQDGEIIFAGTGGIQTFYPQPVNQTMPDIIISEIMISGKPLMDYGISLQNDKSVNTPLLNLPFEHNDISFEFASVHFSNPGRNRLAYKMEGLQDEWIYTNRRYASFPNLDPGEYVFRVKGSNGDGVWNEEGKSIIITINPPWWQTTWAYIGYVFLFAVGVFVVDRFQRRRLLNKVREKARIKESEMRAQIAEAENERKTKELEEARELQLSMLPKDLPNLPNLDIAVYMQTATEVGGDYYDFHVGMDGTLTVVVGDATGHGMRAGTMVTATKSLFNILAPNPDILTTFSEISRVIKGMKFNQLSMCLMLLKIKGNELSVSSAAMPPALIYRKKNKAIEEIFMKGMPLGSMNNFPYTLKESHLEQGDTVLLLSDGLPELTNGSNEMYGYDRTKTEFHSVGEKDPEEIVNHLKNSASQWVNDKDPDDDVTFVVIKVK